MTLQHGDVAFGNVPVHGVAGQDRWQIIRDVAWIRVVLADGHGADGSRAAAIAVRVLAGAEESQCADPSGLCAQFAHAHAAVARAVGDSGTTLTVACVGAAAITVAYVGDSEARIARASGPLETLTIPHRLTTHRSERARVIAASGCAPDERRVVSPDGHAVLECTRSIGDEEFDPYVLHTPHVRVRPRDAGDRFLVVGSDGFWDLFVRGRHAHQRRSVLEEIGRTAPTAGAVVRRVQAFLSKKRLHDDCTVIVLALT